MFLLPPAAPSSGHFPEMVVTGYAVFGNTCAAVFLTAPNDAVLNLEKCAIWRTFEKYIFYVRFNKVHPPYL